MELFWWSHFRNGFRRVATQAATYPSSGGGKGCGGTLELTLLLMEQRHKEVCPLVWCIESSATLRQIYGS